MTDKELPFRTEAQIRGDNFAEAAFPVSIEKYIRKLIIQIRAVQDKEINRKMCHCSSCTNNRAGQVSDLLDKYNHAQWTLRPEQKGLQGLKVNRCGSSWEIVAWYKEDGDSKNITIIGDK